MAKHQKIFFGELHNVNEYLKILINLGFLGFIVQVVQKILSSYTNGVWKTLDNRNMINI